jgi:hypothetical protein
MATNSDTYVYVLHTPGPALASLGFLLLFVLFGAVRRVCRTRHLTPTLMIPLALKVCSCPFSMTCHTRRLGFR